MRWLWLNRQGTVVYVDANKVVVEKDASNGKNAVLNADEDGKYDDVKYDNLPYDKIFQNEPGYLC